MEWTLRPVDAADNSFLLRVYAGTRVDELALTTWDEATKDAFVRMQYRAQARHYKAHWPGAEHGVITVQQHGVSRDVGRLWLHRRVDTVHVLDIAVLPEWRSRGVGGRVLRHLMDEADASGRALTIYVEAANPARRLYDRLGFQPVGQPDGAHQFMRWRHVTMEAMETCNEQA